MKTSPDIHVRLQGDDNEFIRIQPTALPPNVYDLIYLLRVETAPRARWRDVACAYFRNGAADSAVEVLLSAAADDVDAVLRGGVDDHPSLPPAARCSRLDLLAALAGAYIMRAATPRVAASLRRDALDHAARVFSRADKIDLDNPAVWAVRGWAEFHAGKHTAVNWFDNASDKSVVLGAMGLAAIRLNRPVAPDPPKPDAVALLVGALRAKRCPPGVWTGLAYALFRQGRSKLARAVARRAVFALRHAAAYERREALYLIALIESAERSAAVVSVEQMAAALREAYVECGGDADARVLALVAEMHFNGGDFAAAERFAARAVRACEGMPNAETGGTMFAAIRNGVKGVALFQLARAQHQLGKVSDAMQGLEEVKRLADLPEGEAGKVNPGVYLRLGLLKLATGRKEDEALAQECLEKVVKDSNDRCGVARRALGVLFGRRVLIGLKRGRPRGGEMFHKAVALLQKGLEEDEDAKADVPAQLVYAGLVEDSAPKVALGAYEQAIRTLEAEKAPIDPEIWNNVSSLMARLGDVDKARELTLSKIDAAYAADCSTIAYNRGRLAEMAEDFGAAQKSFAEFEKESPYYFEAITRLGVMAINDDSKAEQAEQYLKEAMESSLTKPVAAAFLSTLYARQKKFKQAQEVLEVNRNECDYLALSFSSFMHRFLDSLDQERRSRFLLNHIGAPLISILKRSKHNSFAANGVGVYFAESKLISEARDAFTAAGAGELAAKTARVNLAHTQVQLGHKAISDSARTTGRASYKVMSNSRALFEQADKLYRDALDATPLKGTKTEFSSYCELLLYIAWAKYEAREFRASADMLIKLVHLMPTSPVAWFNLGQALLESALNRAVSSITVIEEMELAQEEFSGSRQALTRSLTLNRDQPDPVARSQISKRHTVTVLKYVKQQERTYDVSLRNAKIERETADIARREESRLILEKRKQKLEEEEKKANSERTKKEEELRRAFEESERKKQQFKEEYERQRAREVAQDEDDAEDDVDPSTAKKPRGKRKKKEPPTEEEKEARKAKRQRKPAASKKKVVDGSGSEYSDVGDAYGNGVSNGAKRPLSDASDSGGESEEPKRKRFTLATDENVSDEDF